MTTEELEQIKAELEKITPCAHVCIEYVVTPDGGKELGLHDNEFYSAAPARISALIMLAEALEREVDKQICLQELCHSLANQWQAKNEELEKQNARYREALVKLRDCDWMISLPDRMDAVRDIARQALKEGE